MGAYEEIMHKLNQENKDGTMQGFQVNSQWLRMVTEDLMITNALMGCFYSVLFAFVILIFTTQNWILALLSVTAIAGIVSSCIGFVVIAGWQFGLNEALCITICVGFSVDFVVHVAVGYAAASSKASCPTQYDRIRESLSEIGVSIFSAAITTCG